MRNIVKLILVFVLMMPVMALGQIRSGDLVSVNSDGIGSANGESYNPVISANGRYVAFLSMASNLDPTVTDTNGNPDVYVRDLETGVTRLASFNESGSTTHWAGVYDYYSHPILISPDGRYVVYSSRAYITGIGSTGRHQVMISDMETRTLIPVSVSYVGNSWSNNTSTALQMTPDGRYIMFLSAASNIVYRDTNNNFDIFVHDMQEGITSLVTINAAGTDSANYGLRSDVIPSMTPDGRYVAFYSTATNLVSGIQDGTGTVDAFVRDLVEQRTTVVSVTPDGTSTGYQRNWHAGENLGPSISDDGRFVSFTSQANDLLPGILGYHLYLRDVASQSTTLVSKNYDGTGYGYPAPRNAMFCGDGKYLVYQSSNNFVVEGLPWDNYDDVIIYDIENDTNSGYYAASHQFWNWYLLASSDCRYVAAISPASLVPADGDETWDVYMFETMTGGTTLLSGNSSGTGSGAGESPPNVWEQRLGYDMTPEGQYVVFTSTAEDLVTNDSNGYSDVFVVKAYDNLPPVADAGPDGVAVAGEPIAFDGSGSSDPNDSIVSFVWDFGDGEQATGVAASHVYSATGIYTATLTVTDEYGATATDEAIINVLSRPVANAGPDIRVLVTIETILDGTASADSDGEIVAYNWDFGDGDTGLGALESHWWAPPGTYTVTLVVTDNDGLTAADTATVEVITPSAATVDLAATVDQLAVDGKLTEQRAWPLANIVFQAKDRIDNDNLNAAEGKLRDFIKKVGNLVKAGKLAQLDADPLIRAAEDIIRVITA